MKKNLKSYKVILFISFLILFPSIIFCDEKGDFNLSLSFFNDGYYDLAEQNFNEFLGKYTNSIYKKRVLFYLGISKIELKKYKEALDIFELLKDDKELNFYRDLEYYLALLYTQNKEYTKSMEYIEELLTNEKDKKKVEKISYLQIKNYLLLGNTKEALKKSKDYFENNHYQRYRNEISALLINHFMKNKDYYNAKQVIENVIAQKNDENTKKNIYHNYLITLRELKKNDEALVFFSKNIDYYDKDVYSLIADIYYNNNQKYESLDILKKIFKNNKTLEVLKKIITIQIELGNFDDSIILLEKESRDHELNLLLGELYYKKKEYDKAYDILNKIDIRTYNNIALILYFKISLSLNKRDSIKKYFNNIDILSNLTDSERENILYKLAETFYTDKEYDKTSIVLEKYLNEFQNTDNYETILFINGICLKNIKKYDEAVIEFSKIHKKGKKDEIYFESFVEKGEIFFALQEYKSAIENYKQYLDNRNYLTRKKEVLLQLGNCYYNIKNYKLSYNTYKKYLNEYEDNEFIENKIAYSLLKDENYSEIISYFDKKQNKYDFSNYLIILSYYKLNQYSNVIEKSATLLISDKFTYYSDVAYLNVLSRIEINNFEGIDNLYRMIKINLKPDDITTLAIEKEIFKIYVKTGYVDKAEELFNKVKDIEMIYFIGETLFNSLYIENASVYFKKILNNLSMLKQKDLLIIIDCFIQMNDFENSLMVIDYILKEDKNNIYLLLKKVDIILNMPKDKYDDNILENSLINEYYMAKKEYIYNDNYLKYRDFLLNKLNTHTLDNIYDQKMFLEYIKLEYNNNNFKEVINNILKVPEKVINGLTPEIKFILAESYLNLNDEPKALIEYLKIFYIYPYDTYWVTTSIKAVLNIYEKNNDKEKYDKTIRMFEDKYFKLH